MAPPLPCQLSAEGFSGCLVVEHLDALLAGKEHRWALAGRRLRRGEGGRGGGVGGEGEGWEGWGGRGEGGVSADEPGHTSCTFFLGGSPFILVVVQKLYTLFWLVTGQVSSGAVDPRGARAAEQGIDFLLGQLRFGKRGAS